MAETIRNVVIKLAIQQQPVALKVPDVAPVTKPLEEVSTKVLSVTKAIEGSGFKIGDALKQGGEGAFTAARGFAFLFTSTDEGYKQLIANLSAAQGAFDLTKGAFETIKGVSAALQVAAASGGVYAVAMKGVAFAQSAVAATGAAAAVSVKALWGPVGIAIAGISALLLAGRTLWAAYAEEERSASEAAKPLLTDLDRLRFILKDLSSLEASIIMDREIQSLDEFATVAEKIARIERSRVGTNIALAQLEQGEVGVAALRAQVAQGTKDEQDAALEVLAKIQDLQKTGIEQEKEKLSIYKEHQVALTANLDKQNSIAKAAQDAAKTERERVAGVRESLGRLDPVQLAELRRLSDIVKGGGSLTDEQSKRVGELGGTIGRGFESRQFEQKGRGLEGILTPFNNGVNLTGQGSKLEELTKKEAEETRKFVEQNEATIREMQQLNIRKLQSVNVLTAELKTFFAAKADLDLLKEQISKMAADGNRKNVGMQQR